MMAAAQPAVAQQAQPQGQPQAAQGDQGAPQFGPRAQPQRRGGGQPRPQGPKPEVVATHGDWVIQCEAAAPAPNAGATAQATQAGGGKSDSAAATDAAPAAGTPKAPEKACGMFQSARSETRKNVALTLILVQEKQADKSVTMMRVMAPIGVFLPTGVALEIDGQAVGRVPFTRCIPQMCVAFAEASAPTLDKMKKGSKANFIIYEGPGAGVSLPISLKGFTAALTELASAH